MNENKRFVYVIDNGESTFYDLGPNREIMDLHETEDMLNELNEENERLKSLFNASETSVEALREIEKSLEKENEQLKETIDQICKDYEEAHGMSIRNADWFTAW